MSKVIYTKHAEDRRKQRGITLAAVEETIKRPAKRFEQTEPQGSVKFIKTVDGRRLHVVATYVSNDKAWLVISLWVRGEDDRPSLEEQIILSPFKLLGLIGKLFWKAIFGKK